MASSILRRLSLTTAVLLVAAQSGSSPAEMRFFAPAPGGDSAGSAPTLRLDFAQSGDRLHSDIHSIVDSRFEAVAHALTQPASWCAILPLHFNVKSCIHREVGEEHELSIQIGRKFYQKPLAGHRLALRFDVASSDRDGLELRLASEDGPLGTRNYLLHLAALPTDDDRTLIRFRFGSDIGWVSRVAMSGYLQTLGRGKVGFTVVGQEPEGTPVYVGGVQGMIERNAVRYHLAATAYLETLAVPEEARLGARLGRWYELTSHHRTQLFEMEEAEYLAMKSREWENQQALQP